MAEWFAAKRYGYGAGLPIAWQGWALTIGFIAVAVGMAILFGERPYALVGTLVPLALLFALVAMKTTKGGWRWRWGSKP